MVCGNRRSIRRLTASDTPKKKARFPFGRFIGKTAAPPDTRSKRRESPVVAHRASHCVGSSTMSKKLSLLQEAGYVASAFLRKEILALPRENAAPLPPTRTLPVLRDFPSERTSFPFTGRNPTPAPACRPRLPADLSARSPSRRTTLPLSPPCRGKTATYSLSPI